APTTCVTQISVNAHNAITFDNTVTSPTTLDGFEILNTDSTDNITSGVAVLGSTGAGISNNYILGGARTSESHRVRLPGSGGGAPPLLPHNAIIGGPAPTAIGISSTNSAPTVRAHCDPAMLTSGRCQLYGCGQTGRVGLGFIHGRVAGGA